ncbi:MAG: hypothetical protein J1E63_01615 [Muribaculaceae bacterium]|nr:hypothetical protein [Muribaculaceae bacterium]
MLLSFERFDDGRWYVVFPEYDGPQEDLEMVEGADKMLDALITDGMLVTIDVNLEQPAFQECFILDLKSHDDFGAYYSVNDCQQFTDDVWLCNVVHEFFGEHPERIYCTLIDD